ncbi:RDD family protein [Poriferisphaera corsica]|uniref:RDD family protein n=1 Tax=Poriferisphaera corsica TaxID=2528020 RepID=UPI00190E2123|nr:RDD family protein [Poriferisphaera corsica]
MASNDNLWYVYPHDQTPPAPPTPHTPPTPASAEDDAAQSKAKAEASAKPTPAVSVYHRNINDPTATIAYAANITGYLLPNGLAASPNNLTLAYQLSQGIAFQTVTPIRLSNQDFFSYDIAPQPPILHNGTLRALAASDMHTFAMLNFESADDAQAAIEEFQREEVFDSQQADTQSQDDTNSSSTVTLPDTAPGNDYLFILMNGRWQLTPLPADFPHRRPVWLVAQNPADDYPVIITQPNNNDHDFRIFSYNLKAESWDTTNIALPSPANSTAQSPRTFFAQSNQLIHARQDQSHPDLTIDYTIIRDDHAIPVGSLSLAIPNTSDWQAIPYNANLALLAARPEHKPTKPQTTTSMWGFTPPDSHNIALDLAQLTLQGKPLTIAKTNANFQTLTASIPQFAEQVTQSIISLFLIALATLLLVLFLFRDPKSNIVTLPKHLTYCDFPRRMLAAAIDFGIVFFPLMFVFHKSFSELLGTWPTNANLTFTQMIPAIVLIACFIAHTTITEILTKGRTLGKILTGICVTNLQGNAPTAYQSLFRGLLRIIELLIQIALLFPLFTQHKQRVGDIFAHTVVVIPKSKDTAHHLDEDTHNGDQPQDPSDDEPNDLTKR